jgi:hypothetical protein
LPGFGSRSEYTNCPENVLHTVHFSGSYKLPFGSKMRWQGNRLANAVLGGWQMNWIYTYQSGNWFGVPCTSNALSTFACYANVTGDPYAGARNVNNWLNPSAFENPAKPVAGVDYDPDTGVLFDQTNFSWLGSARNNSLQGPSFHNVDFSVFKEFHASESSYFQFRAEAFNMPNNAQFNNPSRLNFAAAESFGQISGVRNRGRIIQLALKFYY